MPGSIEAALIFAVLIVPGLLLIGGYRRARVHSLPQRDLYVLAQAVAVSLAWLPVVWILGGGSIIDWAEEETLTDHQVDLLALVFLNLVVPVSTGLLVGNIVDWLGGNPKSRIARWLRWTGIFKPPTAWDAAWLRASLGVWAAAEIELKDGRRIGVLFDDGATIDLSPHPAGHLFFDTEYRWTTDGELEVKEHSGIYLTGSEILAIRFEHIEGPDAPK